MVSPVKAGSAFVEILANTTQLEKGLRRASAQLKSFGATATKIGLQLTGLGVALVTPLVLGTKVFADFETSLAKIGTLIDNDQKQLESFGRTVEKLSIQFGQGTGEIADALFDIVSASIPANKAIEVLTASLKLSRAGFTDTKTATSAVITVLKAYGNEANGAAGASDFLFQTAKFGRTTFEQLAKSIGGIATIANLSGLSLNELGAGLATITRSGLSTEEAVTSLRALLLTFLKSTDDAKKAAKEFGLELSSTTLKTQGLQGVLKQIGSLPPDVIARIFPEQRALKGFFALAKNVKGFDRDLIELGKSTGVTDKALVGVLKTLTVLGDIVKETGVSILRNIGKALASEIKSVSDEIISVLNVVNKLVKENAKLIVSFAKITLGVIAAGATFLAAGVAVTGFGIVVGAVASIIGGVVAVLSLMAGAIVFLFSPLGILITLVVTLGVILINQFDLIAKSVDMVMKVVRMLKDTFGTALDEIVAQLKSGNIIGAFNILTASLKVVWVKIIGELLVAWETFQAGVIQGAIAAFTGVLLVVNNIVKELELAWNALIDIFVNVFLEIKNRVQDILGDIASFVAEIVINFSSASDESKKVLIDAIKVASDLEKQERKKTADFINALSAKNASEEKKRIIENAALRERLAKQIGAVLQQQAGIGVEGITEAQARADAALNKAKQDLVDTLAKEKSNRESQSVKESQVRDDTIDLNEELNKALQGLDFIQVNFQTGQQGRITTQGGFSAAALARGGAVSIQDQESLNAQKATAQNTKDTKDILRQQKGFKFA